MDSIPEAFGTISTPRHEVVRYRIGWDCGDTFGAGSDYDGFALTIEAADEADARAMLDAIAERDALRAENERLRDLVNRSAAIFANCNVTDGVCCCGDSMENHPHPMYCGHSPVDHGGYAVDQWMKDYDKGRA